MAKQGRSRFSEAFAFIGSMEAPIEICKGLPESGLGALECLFCPFAKLIQGASSRPFYGAAICAWNLGGCSASTRTAVVIGNRPTAAAHNRSRVDNEKRIKMQREKSEIT